MMMRLTIALLTLALPFSARVAHAEECPQASAVDSGHWREQAKKWFTIGEKAANAGDSLTAIMSFQCSLQFVPHAFTVYNLATLAERIGDLNLAISSYARYLLLAPEAPDSQDVRKKIVVLQERIAAVGKSIRSASATGDLSLPATTAASTPTTIVVPVRAPAPAAGQSASQSDSPGGEASPLGPEDAISSSEPASGHARLAGWLSLGGAGVLLATATVSNLSARSKMDTCRAQYAIDKSHAGACDSADSFAYTSYGLFAVGGATLAFGVVMLLLPTHVSTSTDVSMNLLPEGGMSVRVGGHF